MKSKTTILWFVLAAALFAFIWIYEHHFSESVVPSTSLLFGLRAEAATEFHLSPAGAREISLLRTNNSWFMTKPFAYPAQAGGIGRLLATLEKLTFATRISASELNGKKTTDAGFGFENPQFSVDISAGSQQWHFLIGNRTAPGDQVFIRLVGVEGAFVTDSAWLAQLPRTANEWRDTSVVSPTKVCDWIVITNGTKVIELQQNPTNHVWRMLRPLQARAAGPRITTALQQLRAVSATRFVTDDAKADLTTFGLQPAETDLWLGHGTNYFAAVHAGKKSADDASQVFARREGWNSVLTIPQAALSAWQGSVNDFRDSHLLELTAPITEIEVSGENHFTLQSQGEKGWAVVGEKFPADTESVLAFVKLLASLRAEDFAKDTATPADLQSFGLANPSRQITLRSVAGDTNSTFASLIFGAMETNHIFVKRADENFIYTLAAGDLRRLPDYGLEFRQRQIWNFSVTNVANVTVHQGGLTRQLQRSGTNAWSVVAGQGLINPREVEETVRRLGDLAAEGWVARNFPAPENFGFETNNLKQIVIELKTGEKSTVDFGGLVPNTPTVFAATMLEGERWIFVLPPALAQFVAAYLIPPATP
jgi:hypothetical protein